MPLTDSCRDRRNTCIPVTVLGVVIPIVLLAYYTFGQNTQPKSTVQLVSVLFRHGDRTPTDTYPNDPYRDVKYWTDGWGELTKTGKQQLYNLGLLLRKRYQQLLSENYLPGEIYIVSSDHDRCIMSAQVCLAGLYPPTDRQVWNPDINWQPIPVHTTPRSLDKLIVVKKPCPAYDNELSNVYKSEHLERINEENREMYRYLTEYTGKKVDDVLAVELLYNTLEIEEKNGLELPKWTLEVYPDKMKDLALLSLKVFTYTPFMKKIKAGNLIGQIRDHMTQKVLRTMKLDRKMFVYSGHDMTLVNVMDALGIEDIVKPDNGATLFVELHQPTDGSEHIVQILYLNNTNEVSPVPLKLPKCEDPCTLKTFINIMESVVPKDWEKECEELQYSI